MIQVLIVALTAPIYIFIRFICYRILKKKGLKTTLFRETFFVLFLCYFSLLYTITIMPDFEIFGSQAAVLNNISEINFIPFKIFYDSYNSAINHGNITYLIINCFGNIGVFILIGLFVSLFFKNATVKKVILCGFSVSLFIEICQLPLVRCTDVDDLWMNTLGAFLGYLIFMIIRKLFSNFVIRFRVV